MPRPEVTYDDGELLDWVSANTDAALSNEARYWQALRSFRDRSRELATALDILRSAVDKKTCDEIDNDGAPYQSAYLARAIEFCDRTLAKK